MSKVDKYHSIKRAKLKDSICVWILSDQGEDETASNLSKYTIRQDFPNNETKITGGEESLSLENLLLKLPF